MRTFPLVALTIGFAPAAAAQLEPPATWRWVTDAPATLVTTQDVPDSAWRFVMMAPGWHVTTGPAATMYEPAVRATGRYAVEAELILFPGDSPSGYGIFVGGTGLDSAEPGYLAFQIRRDGQARVERRSGPRTETLIPWTAHDAVKPYPGRGTGSNVVRIAVDPDSVRFSANGRVAFTLSHSDAPLDGHVGFRIGPSLNLHITTLDYIRRLAPYPQR